MSLRETFVVRLFGVQRGELSLRLVVGVVAIITLGAVENLGIATALPLAERELGHLSLYGWIFSGFNMSMVVGGVFFGGVADRRRPSRALIWSVAFFVLGLVLGGVAPTMATLVLARFVQGLGVGGSTVIAYLVVSKYCPPASRSKLLAVFASAWVVPSLLAPPIAGAVAEHLSWRWVFLGIAPFTGIFGALAVRGLTHIEGLYQRSTSGQDLEGGQWSGIFSALVLSVAIVIFLASLGSRGQWAVVGTVVSVVVIGGVLYYLLSRAPVRHRGVFAVTLGVRGAMGVFFFGLEPLLPLMLYGTKGYSVAVAGIVLTSSTLSWTAASWTQSHLMGNWHPQRVMTLGLCIVGGGMALVLINFSDLSSPGLLSQVGWFVCGGGMGLVFPPLSLASLSEALPDRDGAVSSLMQIFSSAGTSIGAGMLGALVGGVTEVNATGPLNQALQTRFAIGLWICVGMIAVSLILLYFASGSNLSGPEPSVAEA